MGGCGWSESRWMGEEMDSGGCKMGREWKKDEKEDEAFTS